MGAARTNISSCSLGLCWRERLKYPLIVALAFFIACSLVTIGFSNPSPSRPVWELHVGRYISIAISGLCGLLLGTVVLVHNTELRGWEAASAVFIALAVSYLIGVVIWTAGFLNGILISNPVSNPANPFPLFNPSQHLLGLTVLLFPEFLGTAVGTMIVRIRLKVGWRRALASMAIAMLTSFSVNILIIISLNVA